jgi:hypothetical protein
LLFDGRTPDLYNIMTDPDPGGPKPSGSVSQHGLAISIPGYGTGTRVCFVITLFHTLQVPATKLAALQKVLQSEFLNAVREASTSCFAKHNFIKDNEL